MDDDPLSLRFTLLFLLILLNAIFAAAEVALLSIKPASLHMLSESGGRRGRILAKLAGNSANFLSTIQIGVTLAGFLASAFAADSFATPMTHRLMDMGVTFLSEDALHTFAVILITLVLAFFSLVFGELVPKQIGLMYADKVALYSAGFISMFSRLTAPLVWLLSVSVAAILKLLGVVHHNRHDVTEEEIRIMVDIGEKSGAIESDERQMIENVFEFNNITAEDVMNHRTNIVAINVDATPESVERILTESGFSRVPVYRDSIDQIIGFLHFRDYFAAKMDNAEPKIFDLVKPVYLAPASIRANVLFRRMQRDKYGMAIILDEYGGTAGLVTIEDLLEEIVGSLYDEFDEPETGIELLAENLWRIDGAMRIDDVTKATKVELPKGEFDSIGGLVFEMLDEVPAVDNIVNLTGYNAVLTVEAVSDRRIDKVMLRYTPKIDAEDEGEDDDE